MTPGDLYRTCARSAYRLEVLQNYVVATDQERQAAFLNGEPLPPPRLGKQDDLRLISELRRNGRDVGRVHVVTWPLSDYIRYELAVYAENVDAGEYVRIADATAHHELSALVRDFAIFDVETDSPDVILFNYTSQGHVLGYEHTQDPAIIEQTWRHYRLALERSVPLTEFIAAHELHVQ